MNLRQKIYNIMVNRHPGISYRYHKMHDSSRGAAKVASWFYLMWLNFAYYVMFFRFLGKKRNVEYYESKRMTIENSESQDYLHENPQLRVSEYVHRLSKYDIISFDIFDTLIFRPLSLPADVFYLIGEQMGILDFKNIRTHAEYEARILCNQKHGHTEISLEDIWKNLERDSGFSAMKGIRTEKHTEDKLCYANPFMLEVWKQLTAMNKKMIIVSDMYLPKDCIVKILERVGFTGAAKIYISNEYHMNKAGGSLFREVIRDWYGFSIVHVGDNPHSDVKMARNSGLDVLPYPNVNRNTLLYRPFDMSYLVGSAYRGLVSNHLYNGLRAYSLEYEYGYLYGGLFVLGYCSFIHDYCSKNQIEKLLFLSRDGDILKKAYDYLYPGENTDYVYWSRKAATKLMANEDRHDYFRRFIFHKVNQQYTIKDILHSMELDFLTDELCDWRNLKPEDELTDKNGSLLRKFIEARWDKVLAAYDLQQKGAEKYYKKILHSCSKAAAVDIGWAGSGALALSHLVSQVWNIGCDIVGIMAGTNTIHNAEPDASEPFLQSGRLVAYLYSQSHNRDLLKKHDPNKDYNVFWELLLSSPTPQFVGFCEGKKDINAGLEKTVYLKDIDITLCFGKQDVCREGSMEIQRGILDFVHAYREHFKDFPYMLHISGRDAYAPMLVAASHNEQYLKKIEKRFALKINVD